MKRGEMNEVVCEEADVGRCNHKWIVLGFTLEATSLIGWMWHGKGWLPQSGKYAIYNDPSDDGDYRSQYRNVRLDVRAGYL